MHAYEIIIKKKGQNKDCTPLPTSGMGGFLNVGLRWKLLAGASKEAALSGAIRGSIVGAMAGGHCISGCGK